MRLIFKQLKIDYQAVVHVDFRYKILHLINKKLAKNFYDHATSST